MAIGVTGRNPQASRVSKAGWLTDRWHRTAVHDIDGSGPAVLTIGRLVKAMPAGSRYVLVRHVSRQTAGTIVAPDI